MGMVLLRGRCTPLPLSPLRERVAPHAPWARACSQSVIEKQLTWSICMPKITSQELCAGTVFQAEIYPGATGDLISPFVPCLLPLPPALPLIRVLVFPVGDCIFFLIPQFQTHMEGKRSTGDI